MDLMKSVVKMVICHLGFWIPTFRDFGLQYTNIQLFIY